MLLLKWLTFWKKSLPTEKTEKKDNKLFFIRKRFFSTKEDKKDKTRLKSDKRKVKRSLKRLKAFFHLSLFVLMVFGFYLFVNSSFFTISRIDCIQEGFPCRQSLFFEELRGKNIFFLDADKWALKTKDSLLQISKIEVEKKVPDRLSIEVFLRKPLAGFSKEGEVWYLVDQTGLVYDLVYELPQDVNKIYVDKNSTEVFLGAKLDSDVLLKSLYLSSELKKNFIHFDKIISSKYRKITVLLGGNITATFSAEKAITPQVDSLQFILKQSKIEGSPPAYIDFSFDKPVIK